MPKNVKIKTQTIVINTFKKFKLKPKKITDLNEYINTNIPDEIHNIN